MEIRLAELEERLQLLKLQRHEIRRARLGNSQNKPDNEEVTTLATAASEEQGNTPPQRRWPFLHRRGGTWTVGKKATQTTAGRSPLCPTETYSYIMKSGVLY